MVEVLWDDELDTDVLDGVDEMLEEEVVVVTCPYGGA